MDEPIKFFNYMSSPVRRKSLPTPRSVFNFNKPNKFLTQSIKRPQTIREIIRNTPTMMTVIVHFVNNSLDVLKHIQNFEASNNRKKKFK